MSFNCADGVHETELVVVDEESRNVSCACEALEYEFFERSALRCFVRVMCVGKKRSVWMVVGQFIPFPCEVGSDFVHENGFLVELSCAVEGGLADV